MRYKVERLQDDTYQVFITDWDEQTELFMLSYGDDPEDFERETELVYQGSLTDCEAYIKLKENVNVDF